MESKSVQYSKRSKENINSKRVKKIRALNKQFLVQNKKRQSEFWGTVVVSYCFCRYIFSCYHQANRGTQLAGRGLPCPFLKIKKGFPIFGKQISWFFSSAW